ncbi:DNA polymerase epsilon subunit 1 [Fasciola hepatica]|uniref:Translation initiation factor eIF2B subunit gamma n=1 Tax=Fasciola hepatica TaxID=6192 RepID=A0A4E0RUX6_FASHE|nr:DNA polymerase epsilon subunit 1 [Fasciola hepatica]
MQAVILAHSEPSELSQLTISSCCGLLPFHNGTLLSNLIDRFLESDVCEIIIVHQDAHTSVLEQFINKHRPEWPKHMEISLCAVPASCPVLDCFQRLRSRIHSEYIFLTETTVAVTDLNLRRLFLTLIRNRAELVAVFSSLSTTESKVLKSIPRELVLLQNHSDALLGYFSAAEIKKHSTVPRSLIQAGSDVLIRSDLREVGFYLFTRSCMDILTRSRDDTGSRKKTMAQFISNFPSNNSRLTNPIVTGSGIGDPFENASGEMDNFYMTTEQSFGAFIYEHRDEKVCIKLDDPFLFAEAVRMAVQKSTIQKKGNYIADGFEPDPTAVIRSSFVCSGCKIEPGVEIINSLLLPGVTVRQKCSLQGCILGENVTVEEGCKLKNCAAATGQRVPAETILEAEMLGFTDPELEGGQT